MSVANVAVVGLDDAQAIVGPQGQQLIPCITSQSCGSNRMSAGMVVMPPRTNSLLHHHAENDIIVMCVQGWAATLVGPQFQPRLHGPGEFIYVPAGVLHVAVNLSDTDILVAVEVRTDPHFNDDVIVDIDRQAEAAAAAAAVRDCFDVTTARDVRGRQLAGLAAEFEVISNAQRAFAAR